MGPLKYWVGKIFKYLNPSQKRKNHLKHLGEDFLIVIISSQDKA